MIISRRTAILYYISNRALKAAVILAILVTAAYACHLAGIASPQNSCCAHITGLIRSFIYIFIFFSWGISVRRRILRKQTRYFMFTLAMLMVFWMILRTLRYYAADNHDLARILWYMYYIPMLMIPVFMLFTAISLGKQDEYSLPVIVRLLIIPTALLIVMVLTNDIHHMAFTFKSDPLLPQDIIYSYSSGYLLIQAFNTSVILAALGIMAVKCRSPKAGRPRILPLIPLELMIIYMMLYVSDVKWLRSILGDMAAVNCLLTMLLLEACIQCRLIPSNAGYSELFEICSINAKITDENLNIRYDSDDKSAPAREMMYQAAVGSAENTAVQLDRNTLLKCSRLTHGYVFWQEDIKTLSDIMEQLEINKNALARKNEIEKKRLESERSINILREQNRLFDIISSRTSRQREQLLKLIDKYNGYDIGSTYQSDEIFCDKYKRMLLAEAAVLGAYIKRKGNLLFLRQQSEYMPAAELRHALEETFANLELTGAICGISERWLADNESFKNNIYKNKALINIDDALRAYRMTEHMIEMSFSSLDSIYIILKEEEKYCKAVVQACTSSNLSAVSDMADCWNYNEEEELYTFTVNLTKCALFASDVCRKGSVYEKDNSEIYTKRC